MYEIVNVQYTGTYNNSGTNIPAVLGEFRASSAADLPAQNVDCHIICGCDGLDIATGDKYIWNGTAWILQPSDRAFSNVYTKSDIDDMITEINDIIAYYHTTLISDTGEIAFYSLGGNVGTWKIYGNGQQNGTPSPDNPIQPEFVGTLDDSDWTIPITCAGQTTPVYLGQVQTVRRVKKLVLDGVNDGEWKKSSTRTGSFYLNVRWNAIVFLGLCDRAVNASTVSQYDSIGKMLVEESGTAKLINLWLFDTNISLDDFKSYLAQQYAAGTPVTVWYVLASPETGIVNEPLCKIGDYADELSSEDAAVTIPTNKGSNTLTVATTPKPSRIEIQGGITHE